MMIPLSQPHCQCRNLQCDEALEVGMASTFPASHKLVDVARWYIDRLTEEQQEQLNKAVSTTCAQGRALKVCSMCSGTDSPIAVLQNLEKALGGKLKVEHSFSCEYAPRKQAWIRENFPNLEILFKDVTELKKNKVVNVLTKELVEVPKVDILIAGFVCKSVSTENNQRKKYKNCIREATGKTGETFDGMMAYAKKHLPTLVLCENVKGLTMRNKGAEPVILHVRESFCVAGYAFDFKVLDSRKYLLPHRRQRCWMWVFKGIEHQGSVEKTTGTVLALASRDHFSLNTLFKMAGVAESPESGLNKRQEPGKPEARTAYIGCAC